MATDEKYFCTEPWTGVFSVTIELDAVFCPCYLKMKIGNLSDHTLQDLWNSPALVSLRSSFANGELPAVCQPQLCPVAVGLDKHKMGGPRPSVEPLT
jgi:hypothetical protein